MAEYAIYISCAEEDRRATNIIRSAVEAHGIGCASTPHNAPSGELSQFARTAIDHCKVLIVVYSSHSNGCIPLAQEVEYAASREIPILPLRIGDTPMSRDLEFYLSTYHWLDAMGVPPNEVVRTLLARVDSLIAQTTSTVAKDDGPVNPTPRLRSTRFTCCCALIVIPVFLILCALIGTLVFGLFWNTPDLADTLLDSFKTSQTAPAKQRDTKTIWHAGVDEGILEFPNGVTMEFVWCRPGTFLMGTRYHTWTSRPDNVQHEVSLTKGFWMGKYEVTREQWNALIDTIPSVPGQTDLQAPVRGVAWSNCQRYIELLASSGQEGFRLPTEAEWEYACRAGSTADYCFGGDPTRLAEYARYREALYTSSGKPDPPEVVGRRLPNDWGLYDMHGNVSEWCHDWYGNYELSPQIDPTGPENGDERVVRGGSYYDFESKCKSATRAHLYPSAQFSNIGFRLCKDE